MSVLERQRAILKMGVITQLPGKGMVFVSLIGDVLNFS